jgi:hypothetical protein
VISAFLMLLTALLIRQKTPAEAWSLNIIIDYLVLGLENFFSSCRYYDWWRRLALTDNTDKHR